MSGVSTQLPVARCWRDGAHPGHDWMIRSGRRDPLRYCQGNAADGTLKALPCPVVTVHHGHAWDPNEGGLMAGQLLRWCLGDRILHEQPETVMAGVGDRARPSVLEGAAVSGPGTEGVALAAQRCSKASDHTGHAWRGTGTQGAWVYCSGLGISGIHPPAKRCTILGAREHHGHIWIALGQRRWCHGDGTGSCAPDLGAQVQVEISTASLDIEPCTVVPIHGGHSWRPAPGAARVWCTGLSSNPREPVPRAECMVSGSHIRHVWLNTGEWRWCHGHGRTDRADPDQDTYAGISRKGANLELKFGSEAEAQRFRRWWVEHGAAAWADQGDTLRHYKIAGKD